MKRFGGWTVAAMLALASCSAAAVTEDTGGGGGGTGNPAMASSWSWQLSDPLDLSVDVEYIDIDPDSVTAQAIADLKARGVTTIAYISVGTVEEYRADAGDFPDAVVGKTYGDWPDEKFLDIRQRGVLMPIMEARFQNAADMGFDAIEPDNMDVYVNDSGFAISEAETIAYVLDLAQLAHGMGLQIGQKNVPELTAALVDTMDFMIAESCYHDGWCDQTLAYIDAGKPVFDAEYTDTGVDWAAACTYARSVGITMILQDRDLTGASVDAC